MSRPWWRAGGSLSCDIRPIPARDTASTAVRPSHPITGHREEVRKAMARTHVSLGRAAFIPLAACALAFGSAVGVAAQSPDASGVPAVVGPECAKDQLTL